MFETLIKTARATNEKIEVQNTELFAVTLEYDTKELLKKENHVLSNGGFAIAPTHDLAEKKAWSEFFERTALLGSRVDEFAVPNCDVAETDRCKLHELPWLQPAIKQTLAQQYDLYSDEYFVEMENVQHQKIHVPASWVTFFDSKTRYRYPASSAGTACFPTLEGSLVRSAIELVESHQLISSWYTLSIKQVDISKLLTEVSPKVAALYEYVREQTKFFSVLDMSLGGNLSVFTAIHIDTTGRLQATSAAGFDVRQVIEKIIHDSMRIFLSSDVITVSKLDKKIIENFENRMQFWSDEESTHVLVDVIERLPWSTIELDTDSTHMSLDSMLSALEQILNGHIFFKQLPIPVQNQPMTCYRAFSPAALPLFQNESFLENINITINNPIPHPFV